ncbi:M48 family metalloprotease [Haladaptatus sp. DYF46]|uniref:M48 family metalloprotease n=1 Tax=Haladaptatus sp. DYF46 TaxID=2886041 RepID=UPI001E62CB7A
MVALGTPGLLGFLYLVGKRATLWSVGARRVGTDEAAGLHAIASRLARQADIEAPDIAVSHTDVPNAFTVGRSPSNSTIVVTTGLLDVLDRDEVEAVLAHELAHIKHRDVAVMSVASLLPTISLFIASFSLHLVRAFVDVAKQSLRAGVVTLFLVLLSLPFFVVSGLFWLASALLSHIIGRYREYAADRGAVRITGNAAELARALKTLEAEIEGTPTEDLRELDGAAALSVVPLSTQLGLRTPISHPPTEKRIERLRAMEATLEGSTN